MTNPFGRIVAASATALALSFTSLVAPASAFPTEPEGIIGGSWANINDVPWQVGLLSRFAGPELVDAIGCGGTLLNESWIITAAHCVVDARASYISIAAGVDDLEQPRGTSELPAKTLIVHPGYEDWYNDLALIQVRGSFDVSDEAIEPITLPLNLDGDITPVTGTDILVSGWGEYVAYGAGQYPSMLRKATLDVLADSPGDACGFYESGDWNYLYEMCVGIDGGGTDTCQGDSGGPYVALNLDGDGDGTNEPTLVGVTSWGNGCADAGYPGFATRVSAYVDWIIPNAPSVSTTYTPGTGVHKVSWTPRSEQSVSTPVNGYRVEYSLDDGDTWSLAATVSKTTRSISRSYASNAVWRVSAVNAVNKNLGPYLWSDESGSMEDRGLAAPDAPTDLVTWDYGRAKLMFEWAQPESIHGSAVWQYRIYRERPGQSPQLVGRAGNGETSKAVSTLNRATGRVYPVSDYFIVAVNNDGESVSSNVVEGYSSRN